MRSRRLRALALALAGLAAGGLAALELALRTLPLPDGLEIAPSTVVRFRDGTPLHVFLAPDERWRIPVELGRVDPDYLRALVRLEDRRFRSHGGVDVLAVLRAAALNLRRGQVVSGASTISMQLARLVEPRPRTLRSKAIEAFRAIQLERHLGKDEILRRYLERVPYGGNHEGVETASWMMFGHSAASLTPAEIATLLAVPQAPSSRSVGAENRERLTRARDEIALTLAKRGALEGDDSLRELLHTPVPGEMRALPRGAPHAAYWLRAAWPGIHPASIATTLDRDVQLLAERVLAAAAHDVRPLGIHNAAAVVVDHRDGELRALVGNFDFWDAEHGGQIPGFDVRRSPGSALKPLLYALALERGLALPEYLVADVPVRFAGYAPRNYDERYRGPVRLEEALSQSLNVPFVNLLAEVGVPEMLEALRDLGVREIVDEPGHYGLSAAVGGVELTPIELAGVYAMLAHDGVARELRWFAAEGPAAEARILSPGTAHLTRRALASKDRPDFPSRRRISGSPRGIHWKTGTSFGHRDAWAVGSDARHTVVVWLGNFDRAPARDLVGAEAAGPILFDLLEALAEGAPAARRDSRPSDLIEVELCQLSGRLPTRACPRTRPALALRTRVPGEPCPYHARFDVDAETGLRLAPGCRAGRPVRSEPFVIWPASLERWIRADDRTLPSPPPYASGCAPAAPGTAPRILSPPRGLMAMLIPGMPAEQQQIPLEAESAATELSWFANGSFLGRAPAGDRLWWTPSPGSHELLVLDDAGRSARRLLEVRGG